MKPYLYILGVLLVGGGIGFYLGQRNLSFAPREDRQTYSNSEDDARKEIYQVFERQREAFRLHDALLLARDYSTSYVEVNGSTGESYDLRKAVIRYYETLKPGKSIAFNLNNPEISISRNSAVVKASYSKTSDQYEQEGFRGWVGQGVWLLSKSNGKWEICAFAWTGMD